MQLPYSNLKISHQNAEASMPLVLPVSVICNTSDEQINENIKANSRRPGKWVKRLPAQAGVAIICGSGPSLAESLERIRELFEERDCTIFALNGAARFLAEKGLTADYQVMVDARPETAALVGPAYGHLFASQCHPSTFERAENPTLWHLQVEGIDDLLPEYDDDFTMVGGAASVGNCATCLAYVLGFREVHCFGFDSSNRGDQSHAFRQPLNDGEPRCSVRFNGKDYIASLTMKLQAERFMETAVALKDLGVKIFVHGEGLLPDMYNAPPLSEQEKYQLMWANPAYSVDAPGEAVVERFLQLCRPKGHIIDFGCGTGKAALAMYLPPERNVTLVDFVTNSRVASALTLPFVQADLSKSIALRGDYGFCTDVLEHIPGDQVKAVVKNILACVPLAFFQISYVQDAFGGLLGQPLHLSVHPHDWWRELFEALGYRILWNHDDGDSGCFVISVD
jgi:hypothetical protein